MHELSVVESESEESDSDEDDDDGDDWDEVSEVEEVDDEITRMLKKTETSSSKKKPLTRKQRKEAMDDDDFIDDSELDGKREIVIQGSKSKAKRTYGQCMSFEDTVVMLLQRAINRNLKNA